MNWYCIWHEFAAAHSNKAMTSSMPGVDSEVAFLLQGNLGAELCATSWLPYATTDCTTILVSALTCPAC